MRKALIAAQVTLALLLCEQAQAQPRRAADPDAGVVTTLTAADRSQLEAIPQAFSTAWARVAMSTPNSEARDQFMPRPRVSLARIAALC